MIRYFRKAITGQAGTANFASGLDSGPTKKHFKYSIYMQSKDHTWLDRNLHNTSEDHEPLEEDIRD